MDGRIELINHKRGMVGVWTDEAGYSTFELLSDDEIEVGHVVSWEDDTANGDTMLTNHTTGYKFMVYFQNHWVSRESIRQQLLFEDGQ